MSTEFERGYQTALQEQLATLLPYRLTLNEDRVSYNMEVNRIIQELISKNVALQKQTVLDEPKWTPEELQERLLKSPTMRNLVRAQMASNIAAGFVSKFGTGDVTALSLGQADEIMRECGI